MFMVMSRRENIKVLYILNSASKHGGANKSFFNMLEGLIKKGIEPYVILPEYGDLCVLLNNSGVSYSVIKYYHSVYPHIKTIKDLFFYVPRIFRVLFINKCAFKKIIFVAKSFIPDMIHTNVGPIHLGHKMGYYLGVPHVWHLREYQDLDFDMTPLFSKKMFVKKLKNKNNHSIAITFGISRHFDLSYASKVISNGVMKSAELIFNPNKKKYFLYAGRLEEKKGIKELIIAFKEIVKEYSEYSLLVAGDTANESYKKTLILLVGKLGLKENVKFLGMIDNVYGLMKDAIALIVPSVNEGFGRITVEAMFCGCLVIGNNTAGTKEILENNDIGILYYGHDELVAAMKSVIANGIESYFPLIKNSQDCVIDLYSIEKNVSSVFDYYQEIMGVSKKSEVL